MTLIGPLVLVGLATFPWWLPFLGIGVSELNIIYWGGIVGATIGALVPSWKFFMDENHQLLRWGYTSGLFGTKNDAKKTLEWAFAMIIFILLAPPKVNSPVPLVSSQFLLAHSSACELVGSFIEFPEQSFA